MVDWESYAESFEAPTNKFPLAPSKELRKFSLSVKWKHSRSLKVAVQGLDFEAQPLYIHVSSGVGITVI
jgi:hypothetical protein